MKYVGVCWYVALVVHSIKIPGTGNTMLAIGVPRRKTEKTDKVKKKRVHQCRKGV